MGIRVGIDLGTTYTKIAYVDALGTPVCINNMEGTDLTPSVVFFESLEKVIVGEEAKELSYLEPEKAISGIKKLLGKSNFAINIQDSDLEPEQVAALIIKKIIHDAAEVIGEEIDEVIIAVPATWGMNEVTALRNSVLIMLSINPFEFHEEVHVLEHLDRLIEIFSACWPLYAAMPALLKASFEQAYINHGWDLNHSVYVDRGNGKYPSFKDVVEILPVLLDKSEFSAQTKGDYVGSLVTRVESLTNGLLGQIFTGNAIEDAVLFDENTIIDLSRIGSAETKALLMGVLVLKLSEYRQSTATGTNCPVKHITILEEAHNLLKRTSTDQGQESANVQGKSVEMISNSIAEMRTYGEGFIIVDQSPTAVDISAIKNTNTKIIMRLPEANDCEAVGRSIPENMYEATDREQFKECNSQLKSEVAINKELREQFDDEQLEQIENGDTPDGYTWHHDAEAGKMQLVDTETHQKTGHTGGRSIWGGGTESR